MKLFLFIASLLFLSQSVIAQQDVEFHIAKHFFAGKNILKVKRDFHDSYLWVLAAGNEVYRINSVDYSIDDYTAKFSAYANLQFIDIAGVNKDFVFIASNSTSLLQYREDVVKVIDSSYGIYASINSIGVDYTGYYVPDASAKLPDHSYAYPLLIATDAGLNYFDYNRGQMLPGSSHLPARVFEATYRTEMFSGIEYQNYGIGTYQFPVIALYEQNIYGGWVWHGPITYGNNIYTCYCIKNTRQPGMDVLYKSESAQMVFAWGTENGVFLNLKDMSADISQPQNHYLDGIKTNKITSMYGLTAFGSDRMTSLIKENLLAGTDKGFYYTNSDYPHGGGRTVNRYTFKHFDELGDIVINDICVDATTYADPRLQVCEDGAWLATEQGLYFLTPDYSRFLPETYQRAIAFGDVDPSVSNIQVCPDKPVIITINFDIYTGNTVQWYKDGQPMPGENQIFLSVTQPGDYSARFYDPCSSNTYVQTNHLKVNGLTTLLDYQDKNIFCDGTIAGFSAAYNPTFRYRWYKDGKMLTSISYSLSVTESGKYKVEVSRCQDVWEPSKEIEVTFIKTPAPVVTPDKKNYCVGDEAYLSLNVPTDPYYTIKWFKDGKALPGTDNRTALRVAEGGDYSVTLTSKVPNCSQKSKPVTLIFNPLPAITIQQTIKTNLCDGQPVELQAAYSSGTVKWSTGETGGKITVRHTGHYTATVTSLSECGSSSGVDIQFLPAPVLGLPDASLCPFTRQQITLTAPPGFVKYTWNGISGSNTFTTGKLGPVELVVTDHNNCTASQTINISIYCDDLMVPNTFTPNNDGANDTWLIGGINNDPTVMVKIYNRNGMPVFESRGYSKPWDGTYQGRKLPTGTYYYVITAKSGAKIISGSVTIIY